jgi:hypothetical protein
MKAPLLAHVVVERIDRGRPPFSSVGVDHGGLGVLPSPAVRRLPPAIIG